MEILIVGFVLAATAYSWFHGNQAWKEVAEQVDLIHSSSMGVGKKLHGHLRGFDVQVEQVSDNNKGQQILAKVHAVNPTFTLGRDSAFQRMIKPDIETGDQLFDERTRIEGDPDWALALLGPDARRLTEIMVTGWDGALKKGTLTASYKEIRDTASTLDTLLDLAQLLRQPPYAELPGLLKERACHDPSSAVRFQAFRRLTSSTSFREEAIEAAVTLLSSPAPFLKLEACRLLLRLSPVQSDRAAKELVALVAQRQGDASARCSALETLTKSRYLASAIPAMSEILRRPDAPLVRAAALEGLIRSGAKEELLEIQLDGEAEAEILARGLARFGSFAQPRLLEILAKLRRSCSHGRREIPRRGRGF